MFPHGHEKKASWELEINVLGLHDFNRRREKKKKKRLRLPNSDLKSEEKKTQ